MNDLLTSLIADYDRHRLAAEVLLSGLGSADPDDPDDDGLTPAQAHAQAAVHAQLAQAAATALAAVAQATAADLAASR